MPTDHEPIDEPGLETTRATPLTDDPGVVAGRYRIIRVLGRGGGGTVWLARDEHLGREVALKRVAGEADNEVLVQRGLREARTSAALAHDNVVRVFDAFEHEGAPWIVMEYVPGPSLAQLLEDGSSLPPQQVARLGAQLATALASAHRLGILHRDVKPANVLLDESQEQAKLTDFGIARGEDDHQLTRTGMVSGTAAFFSPELAQGQDPSPASDVWALGATLYAAVEGRRPFPDAANAVAQLHTIVREEPLEPRLAGPLTPVLAGMLTGDPERRWTAERAATALAGIADGTAGPPPQPSPFAPPRGHRSGAGYQPAHTTRQVSPEPTRQVPHRRAEPARAAYQPPPEPRRAPARAYPPPRRRRRGVAMAWLVAIPLLAILGWLAWSYLSGQDWPGGDGDRTTSTSTPVTGDPEALGEVEAGERARDFYRTLVDGGLDAARPMLGPDAAIDDGITDGLTRIDWPGTTTRTNEDGTVTVGITVTYTYGDTTYAQDETLVLERTEPGAEPLIVSRTTTDPVITTPGGEENGGGEGDGSGDGDNRGGDSGNNGNENGNGNNGNGNGNGNNGNGNG